MIFRDVELKRFSDLLENDLVLVGRAGRLYPPTVEGNDDDAEVTVVHPMALTIGEQRRALEAIDFLMQIAKPGNLTGDLDKDHKILDGLADARALVALMPVRRVV